jgi:3D (Asp-Asp-Asp) domain-containing protein
MKRIIAILSLMVFSGMAINSHTDVSKPLKTIDVEPAISVEVTATMYNAVVGQCDADPFITADGSKINPKKASELKWVALSRNLLKRWGGQFNYGDFVEISGAGNKDGIYQIKDCMNRRFKNKIDILETKGTKLYKFNKVKLKKVSPII